MAPRRRFELIAMAGAVYAFVIYLIAFTLEVLFIIDLSKRSESILGFNQNQYQAQNNHNSLSAFSSLKASPSELLGDNSHTNNQAQLSANDRAQAYYAARLALESIQNHLTLCCLATSILYFVLFVGSLILMIGLIVRSAFLLLIWICLMATMFIPEVALVLYLSVYAWGLESQNGQIELVFYLLRATLNVIFVLRVHGTLRNWNYEKKFFLNTTSNQQQQQFGFDSPFFIGNSHLAHKAAMASCDPLGLSGSASIPTSTTTINPIFKSSESNLNTNYRYHDSANLTTGGRERRKLNGAYQKHYREQLNSETGDDELEPKLTRTRSNLDLDMNNNDAADCARLAKLNTCQLAKDLAQYRYPHWPSDGSSSQTPERVFHTQWWPRSGSMQSTLTVDDDQKRPQNLHNHCNRINNNTYDVHDADEFDDADYSECELDLDYRTLTTQRHYYNQQQQQQQPQQTSSSRLSQYKSIESPVQANLPCADQCVANNNNNCSCETITTQRRSRNRTNHTTTALGAFRETENIYLSSHTPD